MVIDFRRKFSFFPPSQVLEGLALLYGGVHLLSLWRVDVLHKLQQRRSLYLLIPEPAEAAGSAAADTPPKQKRHAKKQIDKKNGCQRNKPQFTKKLNTKTQPKTTKKTNNKSRKQEKAKRNEIGKQ